MAVQIPNCPYCGGRLVNVDYQVARNIYWKCRKCSYHPNETEQYIIEHMKFENPTDNTQSQEGDT